jgi:hypothetical protein
MLVVEGAVVFAVVVAAVSLVAVDVVGLGVVVPLAGDVGAAELPELL